MARASGFVVWLTGLPCSGKSTVASALGARLRGNDMGSSQIGSTGLRSIEILDGDEFRRELCQELGFSREHRDVNVRRLAYVAALLSRNGTGVIVAAVSPYRQARQEARERIGRFIEVYVHCPLSLCEERDVKGMYALARAGRIAGFTGVSDPYEPPEHAEVDIDTSVVSVPQGVDSILAALSARQYL
ncbi:MAG TPA: adenylyl-sulfate kinase [Polyangiaceae bacterium]|nr:adenylyl-sulfate kinase [Polyangiaceae bacterium]